MLPSIWISFPCMFLLTSAHPSSLSTNHAKRAISPKVSGVPEVVGVVSDPIWNRDSCTSTRVHQRELWTCRDSNLVNGFAFIASTASWTNLSSLGSPEITNGTYTMYGKNRLDAAYFPVQSDECGGTAGNCGNRTRYAIWPDTKPLPVDGPDGSVLLYTWIRKTYISFTFETLVDHPATTLYRAKYSPDTGLDVLPPVEVVDEEFWPQNSTTYGNYGFVIHDGIAYLYGQLENGIALAKVAVHSIEDKTAYSYYNGAGWSDTPADLSDDSAAIPNAGTGSQGTFYYSDYFSSFVWIGAPSVSYCQAIFQIATAPAPEGPWTTPKDIYTGESGSSACGAYSLQAHPGLSKNFGSGNDIYLTYTKTDDMYSTPLIHVVWQ